ncbi:MULTISPECIES: BON domain-containing protein [Catenuloplanes]|uniref:BON domain-containing protein n=1 Tax=Catenuloplanes niger TaxID=587534 RepID=A0AAE4A1I9_9ACTN|nr:BON domain-containing protein [Catenuloplanes niger]MDR7327540.1 hypothetical protein [Catenuloplanes niger]
MATLPVPDDGSGAGSHDRDTRLAYQVARDLMGEDRDRYRQIVISVQNRVVILTGRASAATRDAAAGIARHSSGVADVCNLIQVWGEPAEPAGAGHAASDRSRFDEIVAPMAKEAARWSGRRPVHTLGIRTLVVSAVTLGTAWSTLLIVTVALGWQAGILAAAFVALVMVIVNSRRLLRYAAGRHTGRPTAPGTPPS